MYPDLQKELTAFERRTPKSAEAHKKNLKRIPLGVASNYRAYDPWPIFVKEASGSKFRDLDGNEYIDHNLTFGALMAGHCHPAVVAAVRERLELGTMYGMPHTLEYDLADEICQRFPMDQVRFGSSGTEVTMHAIRLARGFTGRDKIIKMEGAYHGVHDSVLVSMKPKLGTAGPADRPTQVPAASGVPMDTVKNTLIAQFNDLEAVERLFAENPRQIACIIIEPIMMNIGVCMPEEGYLEGLREICTREGALLIFDEVKTGAKLGRGGACEYFNVKADLVTLAKSIGGGFPLAAFAASKSVMDMIASHKVFHAGTYATNPLVMAAGLATFREVLTPAGYDHVGKISDALVDGYNQILKTTSIEAYVESAGANGALLFYPKRIRNFREWQNVDVDLWKLYWFGMINQGVMAQPYWWDEQWTISMAHSFADVDKHLTAFEKIAPLIEQMQAESKLQAVS
jgi:glutamate-1-semialdehyde 2,1-aminomutase